MGGIVLSYAPAPRWSFAGPTTGHTPMQARAGESERNRRYDIRHRISPSLANCSRCFGLIETLHLARAALRASGFLVCPDPGGLDDGPPFLDFGLLKCGKRPGCLGVPRGNLLCK